MSVRLFVKDKGNHGAIHEVGTDVHDRLILEEDGTIAYYNLQNGESTGFYGDYEFCNPDGSDPRKIAADYRQFAFLDCGKK